MKGIRNVNQSQLTVNVHRDRLLATLKENREKHGADYEQARVGYVAVTAKQIKEYLVRLAGGELLERAYLPNPPENHTKDYDFAIQMMEWSTDETIELTQTQFAQYVQDNWGWRDRWMVSNSAYMEIASQRPRLEEI